MKRAADSRPYVFWEVEFDFFEKWHIDVEVLYVRSNRFVPLCSMVGLLQFLKCLKMSCQLFNKSQRFV